jgi:hypothetical protein
LQDVDGVLPGRVRLSEQGNCQGEC